MNHEQKELYLKIRTHLGKLHKQWRDDPMCDGYCKSNEGNVAVMFSAGNWFDCEEDIDLYINKEPVINYVEVYSYLFGPSRLHTFESLQDAWDSVKEW